MKIINMPLMSVKEHQKTLITIWNIINKITGKLNNNVQNSLTFKPLCSVSKTKGDSAEHKNFQKIIII